MAACHTPVTGKMVWKETIRSQRKKRVRNDKLMVRTTGMAVLSSAGAAVSPDQSQRKNRPSKTPISPQKLMTTRARGMNGIILNNLSNVSLPFDRVHFSRKIPLYGEHLGTNTCFRHRITLP